MTEKNVKLSAANKTPDKTPMRDVIGSGPYTFMVTGTPKTANLYNVIDSSISVKIPAFFDWAERTEGENGPSTQAQRQIWLGMNYFNTIETVSLYHTASVEEPAEGDEVKIPSPVLYATATHFAEKWAIKYFVDAVKEVKVSNRPTEEVHGEGKSVKLRNHLSNIRMLLLGAYNPEAAKKITLTKKVLAAVVKNHLDLDIKRVQAMIARGMSETEVAEILMLEPAQVEKLAAVVLPKDESTTIKIDDSTEVSKMGVEKPAK